MSRRAWWITSSVACAAFGVAAKTLLTPEPVKLPPVFVRQTTELNGCTEAAIFTGGKGRLPAGFKLLKENAVAELFISGVGNGFDVKRLAEKNDVTLTRDEAQRVTLDRQAVDTKTNALNTAKWAATVKPCLLVLVTSQEHMPRAVFLMQEAAPDLPLRIAPVFEPMSALKREWVARVESVKLALTQRGFERMPDPDFGVAEATARARACARPLPKGFEWACG